jgi:hypothetical protein
MSIKYHMDRHADLLCILWQGRVTGEEWHAHINKMTAEPDWPAVTRVLADLRRVQDVSTIGHAEITQAVALFSIAPGNLGVKKVAVPASDAFRKAAAFEQAIARFGPSVIVFNTVETACIYLGVDVEQARRVLAGLRAEAP